MSTPSEHQEWLDSAVSRAVDGLSKLGAGVDDDVTLPDQSAVIGVLERLIQVLMPGCLAEGAAVDLSSSLPKIAGCLMTQVDVAFRYTCEATGCPDGCECSRRAREAMEHLLDGLAGVYELLQDDIIAAYEGDPAAKSTREVVVSYPCMLAIATYRIAHVLYEAQVPLIGRIMSEWAHSRTGIDIHPGAQIGRGFFIDHGTGVVVGETCEIGEGVKLYQGVTLGALSFEKDDDGNLVKGIKRHPNVGDQVTIYAGATILGGDTTIGEGTEIGGNVWLIHSVPPGSRVYNQQPDPKIRNAGDS